jgi:hypothetical protein
MERMVPVLLVQVYRNKKVIGDDILLQLAQTLPEVIVESLAFQNNWVLPSDPTISVEEVDVTFYDFGNFDVYKQPLRIIIFADHHPNRARNLNQKANQIAKNLHECVTGLALHSFVVSIWLGTGGSFVAEYIKEN